jgi:hypothetical protein
MPKLWSDTPRKARSVANSCTNYIQGKPTWFDFIQKGDITILSRISCFGDMRNYVKIFDVAEFLIKGRELVEVGGEQTESVDLGGYLSGIDVSQSRMAGIPLSSLTPRLPTPTRIHRMSKYLEETSTYAGRNQSLYEPRPSSSIMIKESFVADCGNFRLRSWVGKQVVTLRIAAVSNISAMNVETPFNWLSPAPTRHSIESNIGKVASEQGTKQPAWAIRTITPACFWWGDVNVRNSNPH